MFYMIREQLWDLVDWLPSDPLFDIFVLRVDAPPKVAQKHPEGTSTPHGTEPISP